MEKKVNAKSIKTAVQILAGIGASMIVEGYISCAKGSTNNFFKKTIMAFGGLAICGALSKVASDYVGNEFDEICETLKKGKELLEKKEIVVEVG